MINFWFQSKVVDDAVNDMPPPLATTSIKQEQNAIETTSDNMMTDTFDDRATDNVHDEVNDDDDDDDSDEVVRSDVEEADFDDDDINWE